MAEGRVGREGRDWPRAFALFAVAFTLSIVGPSALVGIPLVALLLVLPPPRLVALLAGVLIALLAFAGTAPEGLWYVERGWAILLGGWFAALTLRWPESRLFARSLGAVAGALAVVGTVLYVRPGAWEVLDWLVAERMERGVAAGIEALRLMSREGTLSPALLATVERSVFLQAQVFPALLGLASLAALGVAWWLYLRLGHGLRGTLAPVRDFRFNDHFVWLFIGGLVLLLVGWGETLGRAGSNAVVFMGGLYALRGVAVVLFVTGGLSLLGSALALAALLLVAPVVLALAIFIGLGDTWLDLRKRRRRPAA